MNRKKLIVIIVGLLLLISILIGMLIFLFRGKGEEEEQWNPGQMRRGLETAIEYEKTYSAYVPSGEKAEEAIRDYGVMQRKKYTSLPEVKEIELQMEETCGILAVNLGEMDVETAGDVERAFAYMYETYPELYGSLQGCRPLRR